MTRRGSEIDAKKEIIFSIKKLGSCTFSEILEESDVTRGTVGKYLKILIRDNNISATIGEMNGRRTTIYKLTEKGESYYKTKIIENFISSISEPISSSNPGKKGKTLVSIIADANSIDSDYRKPLKSLDQFFTRILNELEKELESTIECEKMACVLMYDQNGFQLI